MNKDKNTIRNVLPWILFLLALTARLLPGARTIDDSYITFRYARNILDGQGFVYNPGQTVLGTTTPLYTFLMVILGSLTGGVDAPFPLLAMGFNALADALTCILLWRIGKKLKAELAGAAAAFVWAIAPYSVTFAIGGLETSLYVLLLTATFYAFLSQRDTTAALFASLALVTRPDAAILVLPLVLHRLYFWIWKKENIRLISLFTFILPSGLWYGFAWLNFGSPFPHSVTAKMVAYHLSANAALIRLVQHYATPFTAHDTLGALGVAVGLVLFPFLFLTGALQTFRTERRSLIYILYPWLYLLAFALPNPLIFRWYLTPPLPSYYLFILIGFEHLLRSILKINPARPITLWQKTLLLAIVVLLPFAATLSEWQIRPDHGPKTPAPEMAWFKLELLYRQAAEIVTPDLEENDVLAAGDVGVLGYFTNATILDTVGLNSPVSTQYYPLPPEQLVTNYAIPCDLILDQQPDWLVFLEVYGRKTLLTSGRFQSEYTLVESLPTDIYGSRGMLIYRRSK